MEDNNKEDNNNKYDNNNKDNNDDTSISASGLDRDVGFFEEVKGNGLMMRRRRRIKQ